MRELTYEEMEQVDGGVLHVSIAIGAIGGAINGYSDAGIQGAVVGGLLGAASGVYGGVAAVATGASRLMFGAYSVGSMVLSDQATGRMPRWYSS